jgi:hypothetical protein
VVLLDTPVSEPELMYLACTAICVSMEEVIEQMRKGPAFDGSLLRCTCGANTLAVPPGAVGVRHADTCASMQSFGGTAVVRA